MSVPPIRLAELFSKDRAAQNQAYLAALAATEAPVDWAYALWDDLVAALKHEDNHVRSIAAQLLCNLAQSDPEGRLLRDFEALLAVTKDERFVTARHGLQALWKVGLAGPAQLRLLLTGLRARFVECAAEKNGTLMRSDILQSLRNLYDRQPAEAIRALALELITLETDLKYQKKYAGIWKIARR